MEMLNEMKMGITEAMSRGFDFERAAAMVAFSGVVFSSNDSNLITAIGESMRSNAHNLDLCYKIMKDAAEKVIGL